MLFCPITVPTVAFSVVSNWAAALTSTACAACPTASVKSIRAVCCTWSSIFVRTVGWKPGASTLTW
jgi:hypothetical protein